MWSSARCLTIAALGGALVASAACRHEPERPPNVLFLVIDALRADHVGAYGYGRDTTPTLDRLAAESVLFEHAYSAGSNTRASVPALLTGLYPTATGVLKIDASLHPEVPMLPELLSRRGYATAAFVANPSLRPEIGLGRGFDVYHHEALLDTGAPPYERFETAVRLQRQALEFLATTGDRPYFLYLHYRDVHAPYVPPPPYDRRYWDPESDSRRTDLRRLKPRELARLGDYSRLPGPQVLEFYVAQYDGEIRYADDRIAEFLDELRRTGKLDDTIVVVTADHGESFLEHGVWDHGNDHFDEQLHVPLLVRLPHRRGAGRRIPEPVSLVDLLPTIAALTGVEAPADVEGSSLVPLIDGIGPWPDRPLFAATDDGRLSVRAGGWKLIYLARSRRPFLVDLVHDPGEQHDLFATRPKKARELERLLLAHLAEAGRLQDEHPAGRQPIDSRSEAELRALGYL